MRLQQEILEGKLFDMEIKIENQEIEIISLKQSKEETDLELSQERFKNETLSHNLNDLEQYSRRNNVRIFGVLDNKREETIHETETIVRDLLRRKLNLNFGPEDFDICHRVGKFTPGANRAIIVKFLYRKSKILTIANRRKLKGSGITISEDLTHKNLQRLQKVKSMSFIEECWTRDGKIFGKDSKNRVKEIKPQDQLSEALFTTAPPSQQQQFASAASGSGASKSNNTKDKTSGAGDAVIGSSNSKTKVQEKNTQNPAENSKIPDETNEKKTPKKNKSKSNLDGSASKKDTSPKGSPKTNTSPSDDPTNQQTSDDPDQTSVKTISVEPDQTSVKTISTDEQAMEITCTDKTTPTPSIDERLKDIAGVNT